MLETIASDPGLQQIELVFLGLFGRACRILESQNQQVILCKASAPQILPTGWKQMVAIPTVVERIFRKDGSAQDIATHWLEADGSYPHCCKKDLPKRWQCSSHSHHAAILTKSKVYMDSKILVFQARSAGKTRLSCRPAPACKLVRRFLQELAEAREEAAELVDLLKGRAAELALTLDADYPDLRSSIWLSEAAAQSAVQTLTPQMTENRKRVSL